MSSDRAETMRPLLRGRRGAVAAGHPLSAEAGLRVLQQGGNAIDAGCAALLAASVIEFSHFSFGGEVPIAIKPAGGAPRVICGQGTAPRLATREFFAQRERSDTAGESAYCSAPGYATIAAEGGRPGALPSAGLLAATVPGVLGAVLSALENFGTASLQAVLQPALELAEDGFALDDVRAQALASRRALLERWPTSARVFLPGGRTPLAGELFTQPDLARTLRELATAERRGAAQGRSAGLQAAHAQFYEGPIAQRIGEFCEQHGGLLRAGDLAGFRAALEEPARASYRGYEVYKTGFWGQGPVLLQVLQLLDGLELRALGHNSAAYVHTLVEALKLGFADRDHYYGDPAFAKVPAAQLLSPEYAAARRRLIDPRSASLLQRPGDPWAGQPLLAAAPQPARAGGGRSGARDTTCVNAVDRAGNLFSATPSGAWLPAVVAADTGVLLGQRLQSFSLEPGHPNALEPGKRPRITLSPTLVLRGGAPFAVLSTPGGDNQDQSLLQVLLNIVEFDMDPQRAVEAARFQTRHLVSSFDDHGFAPGALHLESRIGEATGRELAALGHAVQWHGPFDNPSAPTAIVYRAHSGVAEAAADPRRGRYALAW